MFLVPSFHTGYSGQWTHLVVEWALLHVLIIPWSLLDCFRVSDTHVWSLVKVGSHEFFGFLWSMLVKVR